MWPSYLLLLLMSALIEETKLMPEQEAMCQGPFLNRTGLFLKKAGKCNYCNWEGGGHFFKNYIFSKSVLDYITYLYEQSSNLYINYATYFHKTAAYLVGKYRKNGK